jgi:LPS-assembly lipoprotein
MSWRDQRAIGHLARLAVVFAAASLVAGCFEPLYGSRPSVGGESVHEKLGEVQLGQIPSRQGTPEQRLSVDMHNALQFDLNGGAGATSPTYRLDVTVSTTGFTVIVDVASGRPTAQVSGIAATYQLVEIATGKVVLKDVTYANVDYDVPGGEQRFAIQRALRDAQDRAVQLAAEAIRNRLASYFVAGT